jgi:hypothetical protein
VTGTLAGQSLTSDFEPVLSLQLDPLQLHPGSGSTVPGHQQGGLNQSKPGTVVASASARNALSVRGHELRVGTARWIALAGFLLAATATLLTGLRQLRQPTDPTAHIQARYRHLIVPIAGTAYNPDRPPIDVTSIEALVQLAERSERLVLHHQRDGADTYLVDDEGTLYRYQPRPTGGLEPPAPAVELRQVV